MFHAISYSCKCEIYNRAVRNNFISSRQFVRSLTFVDCSGHTATQDNGGANSYSKHMPSVKIMSDLKAQKRSFSVFVHMEIGIKMKISATPLENLIPESGGNLL